MCADNTVGLDVIALHQNIDTMTKTRKTCKDQFDTLFQIKCFLAHFNRHGGDKRNLRKDEM